MSRCVRSPRAVTRRGFVRMGASAAAVVGLGLVVDAAGPNLFGRKAFAEEALLAENDEGEGTFVPEETLGPDDPQGDAPAARMASAGVTVNEIKGATRYETAAKEATAAYGSSSWALVACGESYADALAAGALAGALDCPILLSGIKSVPDVTMDTLSSLGVSNIIMLGGTDALATSVGTQLKRVANVTRLAGQTRYETQMEIYRYGKREGFWTGDTAIVATGEDFADALAVSPVSFALRAPIFFCDKSGALPAAQKKAIEDNTSFTRLLIVGGTKVVSQATEKYLAQLAQRRGGVAKRLGGELRYDTSAAIASYAVANLGFRWDGVAFASGKVAFDALAGAPLQGRAKSVMLLADSQSSASADAVGDVSSCITFLGGYEAIPVSTRVDVCTKLGISSYRSVATTKYGISLDRMARLEAAGDGANGVSYEEFLTMLDPSSFSYGTQEFYQYSVLTDGYSGLTSAQLNAYVENNCSYSESSYGRKSGLRGRGADFVEAARTYGVNEAYLLAHAIWESGWGCSELAAGWTADKDGVASINGGSYPYKKGTTYYNFYGIGAYDANALSSGRAMAVKQGWTSPRLAILGAAKWISDNYLRRSSGAQDSLYLMKFDVPGAVRGDGIWHQYCTGGNSWVLGISRVMRNCYASAGYSFEDASVSFDVPVYQG